MPDPLPANSITQVRGNTVQNVATKTVGIVGARGHTGKEMVKCIAAHPRLSLAFASTRQMAGESIGEHVGEQSLCEQLYVSIRPEDLASNLADVYVLALPNDASEPFVDAIDQSCPSSTIVVDLSADHRFDDSARWVYGLPEHNAKAIQASTRVANPGCYATAMQLAIRPLLEMLAGPPHCFGVSGYSGAGATPSPRNDPKALEDNLMPYALTNHIHEREVSRHLETPIRFSPHVASFFRGISMTVQMTLTDELSVDAVCDRYDKCYEAHPLVRTTGESIPLVRDVVGQSGAVVGGISVHPDDPTQITAIATLDNLLKGAATQAIQNINLALGFDACEGLIS